MFRLSPTALKDAVNKQWGCPRCFWLRVHQRLRHPDIGLGKIHQQIHDWVYEYLAERHLPQLPAGRLIKTELSVRSQPHNGVELIGYLDGLLALDSGGYAVMDLKTTGKPEYVRTNYALQLNVYAYCLNYPAVLEENGEIINFTPIEELGVLTFTGHRFGFDPPRKGGIVGEIEWHPIPQDQQMVRIAVDRAVAILQQDTLPNSNPNCQWCQFYGRLGCDFTNTVLN